MTPSRASDWAVSSLSHSPWGALITLVLIFAFPSILPAEVTSVLISTRPPNLPSTADFKDSQYKEFIESLVSRPAFWTQALGSRKSIPLPDNSFSAIYLPIAPASKIKEMLPIPDYADIPDQWLIRVRATATVPEQGEYRLVGLGDDVLLVASSGRLLLDARSREHNLDESPGSSNVVGPAGVWGRPLKAGPWQKWRSGQKIDLDILLGGHDVFRSAYLFVEKRGVQLPDRPDHGGLEYPLFVFGPSPPSIPAVPYAIPQDLPMFARPVNPSPSGSMSFNGLSSSSSPANSAFPAPQSSSPSSVQSTTAKPAPPTSAQHSRAHDEWSKRYMIKESKPVRFSAVLTRAQSSPRPPSEWAFLVPVPPQLENQPMARVSYQSKPRPRTRPWPPRRAPSSVNFDIVTVPASSRQKNAMPLKIIYEGEMVSRNLVPAPPGANVRPARLSPQDTQRFTDYRAIPGYMDPSVQAWVAKNIPARQPKEKDLAFAFRVHRELSAYFAYNNDVKMDLPAALRAKSLQCGEAAFLYAGIFRQNGIPARVRSGRWLPQSSPGATDLRHVKVDFYASEVGWVNVEHAPGEKSMEKLKSTFGNDSGFLTLAIDPFTPPTVPGLNVHESPMQGPARVSSGRIGDESSTETWIDLPDEKFKPRRP